MFTNLQIGLKYTRPELANIWGYDGHNGFSLGVFTPKGRNLIILFVTRIKQKSLTQYQDSVTGGMLFWQDEKTGRSNQRIVGAANNGDEIHLFYREIHHTPFEYMGHVSLLRPPTLQPDGSSIFVFRILNDQSEFDDIERFKGQLGGLIETEREQVINSRLGQGRFRELLIARWKGKCALTGVDHPTLLTASHIKPWRISTNSERLNPSNGLLLIPQYGRLFDRGLVTVDRRDGTIRISKAFPEAYWSRSGISPEARLMSICVETQEFLDFHQSHVFVGNAND
jgi:putative restriction endonuclease